VLLRRSNQLNSFSGLCITKLDVMDTLPTLKICTAYSLNGATISEMPTELALLAACQPVYEELPGWEQSTVGVEAFAGLPANAQKYLLRVEELAGVPIDMISTGPDRSQTLVLKHPFENNGMNFETTEERT
jgi:adenylosuccinate synthase